MPTTLRDIGSQAVFWSAFGFGVDAGIEGSLIALQA
jgi:hypothetical protein